jgi:hypothetical protein
MSLESDVRGPSVTLDRLEELFVGDQPNWDAIDFDLNCPRCAYNLRQLPGPRCPECGLEFDWRPLIRRHVDHATLLIEHAWRRRPAFSWLKTLGWTFRPGTIWRRVTLYDAVRPGPLLIFAVTSVLAILALTHLLASAIVQVTFLVTPQPRGGWPVWTWNHPELHQLWMFGTWPMHGDPRYLLLPLGILFGLGGAGMVLFAMQQTLGRCRVRSVHIVRVMAYVAPPLVATAMLLVLAFVFLLPRAMFVGRIPLVPTETVLANAPDWQWAVLAGGVTLIIAVDVALLTAALRRYLRLPRPLFVAIVSSLVAAIFAYTMLLKFGLAVLAE